jgi:hypothetical protein
MAARIANTVAELFIENGLCSTRANLINRLVTPGWC